MFLGLVKCNREIYWIPVRIFYPVKRRTIAATTKVTIMSAKPPIYGMKNFFEVDFSTEHWALLIVGTIWIQLDYCDSMFSRFALRTAVDSQAD